MSEETFGTVELENGMRVTVDETTPEVQIYMSQGLTLEAAIGNVCEDIKNGKAVIGVQLGQVEDVPSVPTQLEHEEVPPEAAV